MPPSLLKKFIAYPMASAMQSFRMVEKSIAMRGVAKTLLYLVQWPFLKIGERRALSTRNSIQSEFDELHGTDTAGIIPLSTFSLSNPNWKHGVRYAPTSPQAFAAAIGLLELNPEALAQFTFVDVGSGKGATLLYSAAMGFKSVIGVELVPELNAIAARNIKLHPIAEQISRSLCDDAIAFKMPSPPLVVFANYPFSSRDLMAKLVANVANCGDGVKYFVAMNFPYDPADLPNVNLRLISRCRIERTCYAFAVLPPRISG